MTLYCKKCGKQLDEKLVLICACGDPYCNETCMIEGHKIENQIKKRNLKDVFRSSNNKL